MADMWLGISIYFMINHQLYEIRIFFLIFRFSFWLYMINKNVQTYWPDVSLLLMRSHPGCQTGLLRLGMGEGHLGFSWAGGVRDVISRLALIFILSRHSSWLGIVQMYFLLSMLLCYWSNHWNTAFYQGDVRDSCRQRLELDAKNFEYAQLHAILSL